MSASRLLSREERRLLADAARLAAKEARRAKEGALSGAGLIAGPALAAHTDELARRSGTLDRLAAELGEHEVRLERLVS